MSLAQPLFVVNLSIFDFFGTRKMKGLSCLLHTPTIGRQETRDFRDRNKLPW